jgi:NADPH:quinone reductase-like Zn-dependent oxidoreductase
MKHQRVVVSRHGAPDVLQVVEEECPEPQAGEVRVRVLAAGVSAYDLMFRQSGRLPGTPKPPFTLGEDVVGTVDKLGEEVARFEIGQIVAASTFSLGVGGGYAEHVCMQADEWVPVPDGVDPAEAVCLVVNYGTAYTMLHRAAKVRPRERILVQGAAGGVGTALLELARLVELDVYGTASSWNHDLVSSLGATPIDYRNAHVVARIRELTGEGVDIVFDPIGGARQILQSYRCLRKGGRLIWFGMAATKKHGLRAIPFTLMMLGILKLFPDGRRAPLAPNAGPVIREVLPELLDLLANGKLRPVVAERVPLTEAARAHAILESGKYAGKVVLLTGE